MHKNIDINLNVLSEFSWDKQNDGRNRQVKTIHLCTEATNVVGTHIKLKGLPFKDNQKAFERNCTTKDTEQVELTTRELKTSIQNLETIIQMIHKKRSTYFVMNKPWVHLHTNSGKQLKQAVLKKLKFKVTNYTSYLFKSRENLCLHSLNKLYTTRKQIASEIGRCYINNFISVREHDAD